MHASIEQLLSLRDGEPVAAEVTAHVAGCGLCSRELTRLRRLRAGLRSLPDWDPPAPRSLPLRSGGRLRRPAAGLALAASLAGAAVLGVWLMPGGESGPPTVVPGDRPATVDALMNQSRYLETVLARLGPRDGVMNASTAATVAELEDSIALIDWRLAGGGEPLTEAERAALWERRVLLMQSLVTVRYAQTGADSF